MINISVTQRSSSPVARKGDRVPVSRTAEQTPNLLAWNRRTFCSARWPAVRGDPAGGSRGLLSLGSALPLKGQELRARLSVRLVPRDPARPDEHSCSVHPSRVAPREAAASRDSRGAWTPFRACRSRLCASATSLLEATQIRQPQPCDSRGRRAPVTVSGGGLSGGSVHRRLVPEWSGRCSGLWPGAKAHGPWCTCRRFPASSIRFSDEHQRPRFLSAVEFLKTVSWKKKKWGQRGVVSVTNITRIPSKQFCLPQIPLPCQSSPLTPARRTAALPRCLRTARPARGGSGRFPFEHFPHRPPRGHHPSTSTAFPEELGGFDLGHISNTLWGK